VWALRVPPFEEPDELAHADYAFTFFDAGRPFHIEAPRLRTEVSKQATYLAGAVGYRAMRYNPFARVSNGYGTAAYFRSVDARAPARSERAPTPRADMPYVAWLYPAGYYALEAGTMLLASKFTAGSLVAAFLAARLANVALLGITLVAAYVIFRRSGLGRTTSLVAVAAVGFFPLESWVSGYIQPDDLVATLFAVTIALSLRSRRDPRAPGGTPYAMFFCIGLLIAATAFTKVHYAFALWLVVVPAMALRIRRAKRLVDATALLAACVALPAIAYALATTAVTPLGHIVSARAWVASAGVRSPSLAGALASVLRNGLRTFGDAYFGGAAFAGFWAHFGMHGVTFFPGRSGSIVSDGIVVLSAITLVLFIAVESKIAIRLARVARRRSPLAALRLVASAAPVNAYCVVSAMLIGIAAVANGGLALQGRYWLPVVVPLGVVLFVQLPKYLNVAARRRAGLALVTVAATYSIVASLFGLGAIGRAFYEKPEAEPTVDSLADIDRVIVRGQTRENVDALTVGRDRAVGFSGYAVDMTTGLPAAVVLLTIDGRERATQHNFRPDQHLSGVFNDDAILRSRFTFTLPSATLRPGTHVVRCYVTDRNATYRLVIRRAIRLDVR
jgi:hypothetical protein